MNRKSVSAVIVILFIVVSISLYMYFESHTVSRLVVPDNYRYIQSAVDAASAGDTVYVKNGIYNESLVINKPLFLIGEDKISTIITAETDSSTIAIEANNVTVKGFTVRSSSSELGIYLDAENCTILDNIIEGCNTGIYINSGNKSFYYISIVGNTVRDNVEEGIVFEGTPFLFNVTGNTITSNSVGIKAKDSYRCLILNNTFTENVNAIDCAGIRLDIMNNTITENTETAVTVHNTPIETSDLTRIWNNNIQKSKTGLNIIQGARHLIIKNTVNNCTTAISFNQTKSRGWITENNITNNTIGLSVTESNQNFYENNLINNTQQAVTDGSSSIDWESNEKGNYWSDYTTRYPNANEIDNTGIWDTPYIIDPNNTDQYPLVRLYPN